MCTNGVESAWFSWVCGAIDAVALESWAPEWRISSRYLLSFVNHHGKNIPTVAIQLFFSFLFPFTIVGRLFSVYSHSGVSCFTWWRLPCRLTLQAPVANIPRECREGRTAFPPSFPGLFSASWNVDNLLHESKPSNKPFPGVAEK